MAQQADRPQRTFLTLRRLGALVAIAVVLGALALFVADNYVVVGVRLMNLRIEMRLAWALLLAFLLGGVAGYAVAWRRNRHRRAA